MSLVRQQPGPEVQQQQLMIGPLLWGVDNSINGVPNCASEWLIKDVARGEWGFGKGCPCFSLAGHFLFTLSLRSL
jgi:hypothetical protein